MLFIQPFKILLFIFCLAPTLLFAQAGNLDATFGVGGIVKMDVSGNNDYGFSTVVQNDGKIIVAGFANIDTLTYNDFVLIRYQTNGQLDSSFGINGMLTTDFWVGSSDEAHSVCLQMDGKIIVAGRSNENNNYDFAVARYNSNGSLDNTFDIDGKVTTNLGGVNDYGSSVKIQSDGKIVLAGFTNNGGINQLATVRYNSNGSLDNTFDNDGIVTTQVGQVYIDGQSMCIQNDGKIIVCGTTKWPNNEYDVVLVRYQANGSLDNTFDIDGILTTDMCYHDDALAMALQPDGKILIAGDSYDTINITMGKNVMLARYLVNGSLDSSFGNNGKVFTEVTNQADYANGIAVQSNGKIVIVGRASDGVADFRIILVRYENNGDLDNSFGNGGLVVSNFTNMLEYGQSIAIQNDGKIVVTGFISEGSFNIFTARYIGDGPASLMDVKNNNQLSIYPNPTNNFIHIHSTVRLHNASLFLYNMQGQKILQEDKVSGYEYVLSRKNLAAGIYQITVLDKGKILGHIKLNIQD